MNKNYLRSIVNKEIEIVFKDNKKVKGKLQIKSNNFVIIEKGIEKKVLVTKIKSIRDLKTGYYLV